MDKHIIKCDQIKHKAFLPIMSQYMGDILTAIFFTWFPLARKTLTTLTMYAIIIYNDIIFNKAQNVKKMTKKAKSKCFCSVPVNFFGKGSCNFSGGLLKVGLPGKLQLQHYVKLRGWVGGEGLLGKQIKD